jgi:Predicted amidophosphoribosyltransferases
LCGRCLSRPPAFDQTYAPFIHQGAIRHLLGNLKFGANYKNARLLGMLLAEHLTNLSGTDVHLPEGGRKPDLILPVPLYKARYRERGFNQAIEIARTVAKELQIPLDLSSCSRHRDTPHQTELSAKKTPQKYEECVFRHQAHPCQTHCDTRRCDDHRFNSP